MNKTYATPAETGHTAAGVADQAIESARRGATHAYESVQSGLDTLREEVPSYVGRKAAALQAGARKGLERARETGSHVRDTVRDSMTRAGDQTVGYVRDEPMKSLLVAAAAGAALVMLVSWLGRHRH